MAVKEEPLTVWRDYCSKPEFNGYEAGTIDYAIMMARQVYQDWKSKGDLVEVHVRRGRKYDSPTVVSIRTDGELRWPVQPKARKLP